MMIVLVGFAVMRAVFSAKDSSAGKDVSRTMKHFDEPPRSEPKRNLEEPKRS